MKTAEFTIETKKIGAGHFQVKVIDSMNDITQWDAMQMVIKKAGF